MSADSIDIFLNIKTELDISWEGVLDMATRQINSGKVSVHPYGFHIIKVHVSADYQLRVHLWLEGARPTQKPEWPPHDHNFDIDSIVLSGMLKHKTWGNSSAVGLSGIVYQVAYSGDKSILSKTTERITLEIDKDDIFPKGHQYHLSKHIYHSIEVPIDSFAATLCFVSNYSQMPSHVVGQEGFDSEYSFTRSMVPDSRKSSLLFAIGKLREDYA